MASRHADVVAQLEAQLRHLTLPSQRGYRRHIEKRLEQMGRPVAPPVVLSDADRAIVEALRHPGLPPMKKNAKSTPAWLYAAADKWNSKRADLDRWFVTGPKDRPGYLSGPFSRSQVERIAASGLLVPVCHEDGHPVAYELKRQAARQAYSA